MKQSTCQQRISSPGGNLGLELSNGYQLIIPHKQTAPFCLELLLLATRVTLLKTMGKCYILKKRNVRHFLFKQLKTY